MKPAGRADVDLGRPDGCRVVHLAQSDREGGANRAAFRIHRALRQIGMDSRFHCGRKFSDDVSAVPASMQAFGRFASRAAAHLNARALRAYPQRGSPFSPVQISYGRLDRDLLAAADVVCLHWIAGAFLRPAQLATIGRPLVWRLSDLWPFTGGCHFPGDCTQFEEECGRCPVLGSKAEHDLSREGHCARQRAYPALDLTIVAPSRWIAGHARRSSLFGERRIEHIPTGVDLAVFRPHPRAAARAAFDLPADGKILLFGGFAAVDDRRKGYEELKAALQLFASSGHATDVLVVVFGGSPEVQADLALPVRHIGRIDDENRLALLYAAADVLVAPSREDNLPNVILEAAACGTPVVAFAAGGVADAVEHGVNGFLAEPGSLDDLARGIAAAITGSGQDHTMRQAARAIAERKFDLAACVRRYRALFEEVAAARREPPRSSR